MELKFQTLPTQNVSSVFFRRKNKRYIKDRGTLVIWSDRLKTAWRCGRERHGWHTESVRTTIYLRLPPFF